MRAALHILLVSERPAELEQIRQLLPPALAQIETCAALAAAEPRIRNANFDAVLLCVDAAYTDELLHERWLRDLDPLDPPVLLLLRAGNGGKISLWEQLPLAGLDRDTLLRSVDRARAQHAHDLHLLKRAECDPLTGLAGRLHFQHRFKDCIAHARRSAGGGCCALLLLELGGVAAVQSGLGADAADELLISAAERLHSSLRTTDLVARLGGARFAILATQLHAPTEAAAVAQSLLGACRFDDTELCEWQLEASIGIAIFPQDADSAEQMLERAAVALRLAQSRGGNAFCYANNELDRHARTEQQLTADIGHALLRGEMELRFQPQVDARNWSVRGVEVLLRWRHPHWGLLAPHEFLGAAERSGAIHHLGSWSLRKACEQQLRWRNDGLPALPLTFNASTSQLERETLAAAMADSVQAGFPAEYLGLEFNAALLTQCSEQHRDLLTDLHAAGFPLSADHFNGDCSVAQLRRVPLTTLKIDRALIGRVHNDRDRAALTESIIQISHALHCNTVAMGVESRAAAVYLGRKRCDRLQGFYITRPLSGDELPRWVQRFSRRAATFQRSL